jgi:hypothetical protein
MNEHHQPVLYLVPNNQLVDQILNKAREYNISAVAYRRKEEISQAFYSGQSVLVASYQALFHGYSKFGVRGGPNEIVQVGTIIVDDAHVAFSTIREQFTLRIDKNKAPESYAFMSNLFRAEFDEIGRLGAFDDIASGQDPWGLIEVPHWGWKAKVGAVREHLRQNQKLYEYTWPLVRDSLELCHALIGGHSIVITPLLPTVDLIPTFQDCPRRVFLSATITDDSSIIQTFDADKNSVAKPITSPSLAGVSERMILIPELTPVNDGVAYAKMLLKWAPPHYASVVLTPSDKTAEKWQDVAFFADSPEKVLEQVKSLVERQSNGPFLWSNRYDGIDLPNDACRLLVLSGLPRASAEYDLYRAAVLSGGASIHNTIAQRLEQGMGRAARGPNDWCVILLLGRDLVAWISRVDNMKRLTASTRAQLEMGATISKNVADSTELNETISKALRRDRDWLEYHAATLASLANTSEVAEKQLEFAAIERAALRLMRNGYFENAVAKLEAFCAKYNEPADASMTGWLFQLAARAAHLWGEETKAAQLQQSAYARNPNLTRPKTLKPYVPLNLPGARAELIVSRLKGYQPRMGLLAEFAETVSHLVAEASSNQFEQALAELGAMIGLATERPESKRGKGPDVLWLLPGNTGIVFEAKSRKKQANPLTKDNLGQLLTSVEWFKEAYPGWTTVPVSVHPNTHATKSIVTGPALALTYTSLQQMIADAKALLEIVCDSAVPEKQLLYRTEKALADSRLHESRLVPTYFAKFESVD